MERGSAEIARVGAETRVPRIQDDDDAGVLDGNIEGAARAAQIAEGDALTAAPVEVHSSDLVHHNIVKVPRFRPANVHPTQQPPP